MKQQASCQTHMKDDKGTGAKKRKHRKQSKGTIAHERRQSKESKGTEAGKRTQMKERNKRESKATSNGKTPKRCDQRKHAKDIHTQKKNASERKHWKGHITEHNLINHRKHNQGTQTHERKSKKRFTHPGELLPSEIWRIRGGDKQKQFTVSFIAIKTVCCKLYLQ